jgi:hypothetical protein
MDLVSLLFCRSWHAAICEDAREARGDAATAEDAQHRSLGFGPDWRLVLAPIAAIALFVLAGSLYAAEDAGSLISALP